MTATAAAKSFRMTKSGNRDCLAGNSKANKVPWSEASATKRSGTMRFIQVNIAVKRAKSAPSEPIIIATVR